MNPAHSTVVQLGAALVLLAASAVIAGVSDDAASLLVAVWGALLVLWAINHFAPN